MWPCGVVYPECLPQWCLGWHLMVSVTVVKCWRLKALTEVKLVNTNVKPAMSVVMPQRPQASMSPSCPVHVTLLLYSIYCAFTVMGSYFHTMLMNLYWKSSFSPFSSWLAIFLPRDNSSLRDSTLICYWYALARFYWFISILIIILTVRCYSLIGRLCNWSAFMLFWSYAAMPSS